jgi:hypothetical protein
MHSSSPPHHHQQQQQDRSISLLYPTTPSLYPTPLSQGRSWAPSGLNDEIYATSTSERRSEGDGHQERLLKFIYQHGDLHPPLSAKQDPPQHRFHERLRINSAHELPALSRQQQRPPPMAEKSPGVAMHELLAELDSESIAELYCMFVRPGVRLAGAEDDCLPIAVDPRGSSITPSSGRAVSVAISEEDVAGLIKDGHQMQQPASDSFAMPSLVSARIVTELEDGFMDHPTDPIVAVTTHEQAPPLPEYELRRRITLEDHEREARLDMIQFELRQRAIAKHLGAPV